MFYINKTSSASGSYGSPRSNGDGYKLPDALLRDYIATMGFAVLTVKDDTVAAVERNEAAYAAYREAHPAAVPTPSEMRRAAYSEGYVEGADWRVEWGGRSRTCDELSQLGMQYAFREENTVADEIRALVEAKVGEIRLAYPDTACIDDYSRDTNKAEG